MSSLCLIRAPISMHNLARWAGERGWFRHRGHAAGFDEGRAVHHLIDEMFGPGELRPFRLLVAPGRAVGSLYGYCRSDGESLREAARIHSPPEHLGVLQLDRLEEKPMPAAWRKGRRIGFDLRVRPVRRLKTSFENGAKKFREGAEVDAYIVEALRRHPGDSSGMSGHGRTRETVYLDWLAEKLGTAAELDRPATRLARFQRVRISRGAAGPEGPDATFHGALIVDNPEHFTALLKRGVGRHRAYGYGMLLLRPPRDRRRGNDA